MNTKDTKDTINQTNNGISAKVIADSINEQGKRTYQPLTDEELQEALRSCPYDTVESLRVRWLYAKDFARAIEEAVWKKNS